MPLVTANGLQFEVERHEAIGPVKGWPILLIMGLGMQLTAWPPAFIDGLRKLGHPVITFDNRDIGLSTKRREWGKPNLLAASLLYTMGLKPPAPYTLDDLCADTAALLDALALPRVHVVGVSMGGMIGQLLTARHPERVASFTCVMSTSGARSLPGPKFEARRALMSRPADPGDVEAVIDHYPPLFGVLAGPGYPTPPHEARERIARGVRRSHHPLGSLRQLVGIVASGDRSRLLKTIKVPTIIVHGSADPLVPVAAAHDLAAKIPGAELRIIDGMGHDLPPGALPLLIDAVAANLKHR